MIKTDVAIIGAGPAGLFAADELADSDLEVVVIEKGKDLGRRRSVTNGVGGAGAYSSGMLNLTPDIGGDPHSFNRNRGEIQKYLDIVDQTFINYGATEEYSGVNSADLKKLKEKASRSGIEFISGKQKFLGTSKVRAVTQKFVESLKEKGIKFLTDTEVLKLKTRDTDRPYKLICEGREVRAKFVIACPGRTGAYWLREQAKELEIKYEYGPIDVGVRVEFPAEIYRPVAKVMRDAKFRMLTDTYDDQVRNFCTNHRGFVIREKHPDFTLVNGHAKPEGKTENTNFAFLSHVELTDPIEDTTRYGRAIAEVATRIGGDRPILQRLKDLKSGKRSTDRRLRRALVKPTLAEYTPGDISMALPHRIVVNILEGLQKLDKVLPGLYSDHTLIYAPEIKFYDTRYPVNKWMETSKPGFYVAGDASGHSRGIVYSAITGIIASQGIKRA